MELLFSEDESRISGFFDALELLKDTEAAVGLPDSAPERCRWLLALHERGVPGAHIPPRPVVSPALARPETRRAVAEGLLSACAAAAEGRPEGVTEGFEQAGRAGADGIRAYIDAGISPGNAPLTVSGGWIRNFSSGRPVYVPGKGFDKPLYDTGALYRAFDFEVRKRSG